jgi:hypothetical protein
LSGKKPRIGDRPLGIKGKPKLNEPAAKSRAGAKITLISAQVLVMTTPEESYRALVQRYMRAGQLSADDQEALEIDRALLGLLPATARSIEQAVADLAVPHAYSAPPPAANSLPALIPVIPVIEPSEPNIAVAPRLDAAEAAVAATQRSADYLAHRQQYKQELWRAWKENGPLLSEEAFAHLKKLEEQFKLSFDDVAQIYGEVTQEIATGKPHPAVSDSEEADEADPDGAEAGKESVELIVEPTVQPKGEGGSEAENTEASEPVESDPLYPSQLADPFERLEKNLEAGKLKAADQITRDILFEIIQLKQDWIDAATLQAFNPSPLDKVAIKALDHLWHNSTPIGGFRRQLQAFGDVPQENLDRRQNDNRLQVLEFSREIGWWADGLEFFKLYDQLNFTAEAPNGHLPALWFWTMPRSEAFRYGNFGLFEERGGCRIEGYVLPAFMRLLKRCGLEI